MSTDELEAITRRHADLWSAKDADGVADLYADDCAYEDVPLGLVIKGRAKLKEHANTMFSGIPDGRVALTSVSASGNHSAREYVYSGTHAMTGKRVSVRGVSILEFRDGKIVRNSDYYDLGSFLRQIDE